VRKNDAFLTEFQAREVKKRVDLLLQKAEAKGRFPTPVDDLVVAAKLEVSRENALDSIFLGELYRKLPNRLKLAPDRLKKALGKVLGLLDRRSRTIHLDESVHKNKRPFLSLHEVAHDYLPWQRETFDLLEDGKSELDDDTRDEFEREANCFASDALFQLDAFTKDAMDCRFGILVPVKLASRYGSSIYAAVRRYVSTNETACAAIVFDKAEDETDRGDYIKVRRSVASKSFEASFGSTWHKMVYGPGEYFYDRLPRKKLSPPGPLQIRDRCGVLHECIAEAFDSSKQIFFLIQDRQNGR
jgi:Zn-dependent peptidase ImmA (M78 family)